jgi:GTP-binding protein YchF
MKWGIIGLPQAGKTTLFQILTRTQPRETHRHGEAQQHIGVVKIPDERFDRLVKLFDGTKVTHATAEFVDVAAINKESLKESSYLNALRSMDGLVHVARFFHNDAVPQAQGGIDPARDFQDVEVELILTDLGIVENRLARIEKDRKKIKSQDLEREQSILEKMKVWLEEGKPLREGDWSAQEKKPLQGFAFLSEKPLLAVLNVDEEKAGSIREMAESEEFAPWRNRRGMHLAAIAGSIEAELATLPDADVPELMASYGLTDLGSIRIVRAACELMGLITFFTLGDKECRAWLIPKGSTALQAAGTIHSDIEKHFIRAEVVGWEAFLQAGGWGGGRIQGALRIEGKEYRVQDGEVINVRHSG